MYLSRHLKIKELRNGSYAVFNNLLLNVLYADKFEVQKIKNFKVRKDEQAVLRRIGVYVDDYTTDDNAELELRNSYEKRKRAFKVMYLLVTNNCNLRCR